MEIDMKQSVKLDDDYFIVEQYLDKTFTEKNLKTPDYIYGSVIYSLLGNRNSLDAFRVLNRAFFEEVVLDVGIYESLIKRMIQDQFCTSYIATLYKLLSFDFKPTDNIVSILLKGDVKNGDKIAKLIMKDALKSGKEEVKQETHHNKNIEDIKEYESDSDTEREIEIEIPEITIDELFNQFVKEGNYFILGGVEEEIPFTIEIKDQEGNTLYTVESQDILQQTDDSSSSEDTEN